MEVLNSLFYFIIVIGILVFIHEFGHFIAARLSGIHADIFSFGMGPRLLGFNKKDGFKFGNLKNWEGNGLCDYRLSLLPIGGYVKVAGMVDESMDTSFLNAEPQPWEFRSKNMFQKIFVLLAGVIMNMLLAIGIFAFIGLIHGRTIWNTTEIGTVDKAGLGYKIGFQPGDKILEINNSPVNNWDAIIEGLTLNELGNNKTIRIRRNGNDTLLTTDGKSMLKAMTGQIAMGIVPPNIYVYVEYVLEKNSPASKIGLKSGDTIYAVNGEKIYDFGMFTKLLAEHKNKKILLEWKRNNSILKDSVAPDLNGKIGFKAGESFLGPVTKKTYNIFEATIVGFQETYKFSVLFVNSVRQIIKGNISAKESLGGPILIAKSASISAKLGLESFLSFMALLSITLAIMNIIPFPALDGGHIMFVLIEAVIRKEIPTKVKIYIQNTGMVILLLFMAYVFYNDIMKLFVK